jgi:hypothetical protein
MAAKKKRYGPSRPGRVPTWVKPPAAARKLAKEALARREELPPSRRGGLSRSAAAEAGITSGVDRAKSIARGDWQPAEDLRDFFSRFRGTHASALAAGKAWGRSKVQQSWDLWGGHPMWLAARQALLAEGLPPGAEPNPSSYWSVGPQEPVDVDVPWADETLAALNAVGADLELRLLMGARLNWLAGRLAFAPSRPRPKMERVTLADIRPVEYPGAEEGWYLDERSGRKVVFEDQVNVGWWREKSYPSNAFTVGEMAALEVELVRAAERIADARENLTPAQRELAVQLVEAAEGLELRLALMQWHPDSPEEAEAMKRSMLEAIARSDEENPRGRANGDCEVLAAHEYTSPRQRELTPEEHNIRHIAYMLKKGRRWAMDEAAVEMAPLATPRDVLVPVPDSSGSTKYNRRLARRIAKRSGSAVCDALTRKLKVPSSRELRAAGVPALTVDAHAMLRMHGCPQGRVLLVDNVATTGGTGLAAADALGVPCALLVWAWHKSHAELRDNPDAYDPDLVVTGRSSAKRAMDHKAVKKQHERSLRKRRKHKVAVLVPCAQQKPYRESRSHRLGYLPALEGKKVDVWVVSEPMGVFPYEWSDEYPNDAYEFAPEHVKGEVREQLVERIRAWVERHGTKYDRIFLALPGHHMALVCDASGGLKVNYYDASISACRELGYCPPTHFRATSRAYVDYLRDAIK